MSEYVNNSEGITIKVSDGKNQSEIKMLSNGNLVMSAGKIEIESGGLNGRL